MPIGVVAALQQGDRVAARGGVEGDAGAGDAAADHDDLEALAGDRLDCCGAGEHQSRKSGRSARPGGARAAPSPGAGGRGAGGRRSARRRAGRRRARPLGRAAGPACASSRRGRGRARRAGRCRRRPRSRAGPPRPGPGRRRARRRRRSGSGARSSFAAPSGPAASFRRASARGPTHAEAPGRGQVVVGRPARQLEQLVQLLARQRLGPERLVGAAGPDRGLDVHAGNQPPAPATSRSGGRAGKHAQPSDGRLPTRPTARAPRACDAVSCSRRLELPVAAVSASRFGGVACGTGIGVASGQRAVPPPPGRRLPPPRRRFRLPGPGTPPERRWRGSDRADPGDGGRRAGTRRQSGGVRRRGFGLRLSRGGGATGSDLPAAATRTSPVTQTGVWSLDGE